MTPNKFVARVTENAPREDTDSDVDMTENKEASREKMKQSQSGEQLQIKNLDRALLIQHNTSADPEEMKHSSRLGHLVHLVIKHLREQGIESDEWNTVIFGDLKHVSENMNLVYAENLPCKKSIYVVTQDSYNTTIFKYLKEGITLSQEFLDAIKIESMELTTLGGLCESLNIPQVDLTLKGNK